MKLKNNIIIFLMFISLIFFCVGEHNLDLIHNYGLWYNDYNNRLDDINDVLNIRKITDCTLLENCLKYNRIYRVSNATIFLSYVSLLLMLGVLLWQRN